MRKMQEKKNLILASEGQAAVERDNGTIIVVPEKKKSEKISTYLRLLNARFEQIHALLARARVCTRRWSAYVDLRGVFISYILARPIKRAGAHGC